MGVCARTMDMWNALNTQSDFCSTCAATHHLRESEPVGDGVLSRTHDMPDKIKQLA